MKTTLENNNLTLFLEGRIDSSNAPSVESEVRPADVLDRVHESSTPSRADA